MAWLDKIKEGLEARGIVQIHMDPCVWYMEDMVPLFYFDDCLMFSHSKDKIDGVYASFQEYFKI